MEFLYSNYNPVKFSRKNFEEKFSELIATAECVNIGVGYVTEESLAHLKRIMELNSQLKMLNLIIGMHFIDKFTKGQFDAATELNKFLKKSHRGQVKVVTPFRFHGKMYVYQDRKDKKLTGIIGSNNLSSILRSTAYRTYETSVFIDDSTYAKEMYEFLQQLSSKACVDIDTLELHMSDFKKAESPLDGSMEVKKLDITELASAMEQKTDVSFEIPVKTTEKSNINAYFGKGRLQSRSGYEKPRQWYEVELILPVEIRRQKDFPKNTPETEGIFTVITDDGWQFKCQVEGGNGNDINKNKNLRSSGDLEILGKWLKGRLESSNDLKVGEPVTNDTLEKYGRKSITMTKLSKEGYWFFDFRGKENN